MPAFNWDAFLEAARFLEQRAGKGIDQEAALRTSVGRAYYAAYCHALKYSTEHLGFVPAKNADDHAKLREHLKSRNRFMGVINRLQRLRDWRNACDYEEESRRATLPSIVREAITEAEWICTGLH